MNRVAGPDLAAYQNDPHHSGLADDVSLLVTPQYGSHQTGLEGVQLRARVTQACYLDHGCLPKVNPRSTRQPEEVDPARRDVFAHLPRRHTETSRLQFFVQLSGNQMDLPQVRLGRVRSNARPMLHRHTRVSVPFHA